MSKEKKYLIYGIGLVLLAFIGATFAYFAVQIVGEKKNVSLTTADLKVVFSNGDGSITSEELEPGWSTTKTFSVTNQTKDTYKYNIVIKDLVNTFVTNGFLVYKITSTNGGYNMSEYVDIPKSSTATDTILAYSVSIPVGVTQEYTIDIQYLNSDTVDQSVDMEKIVSGTIFITEGTVEPTLLGHILADNAIVSTRTDFSVTNRATTTGTIYSTTATEDGSTVYYYSGNTTNNWVKFGTYTSDNIRYRGYYSSTSTLYYEYSTLEECNSATDYNYNCSEYKYANAGDDIYWRIIRTNEGGSVRLLYAGTSPDTTSGYIGKSAFNTSNNNPIYVGYMYGTSGSLANNRTNINDSDIKQTIDTWYENNLLTNYDKYISKEAIYCNDRSIGSGTYNTGDTKFHYGAYTRLETNKTPTYKCGGNTTGGLFESTQAVEDKFSASTDGGGNGQLKYPIAIMTADEVAFAGGKAFTTLSSPYAWYYTNSTGGSITGTSYWWTMAPSNWSGSFSRVWEVYGSDYPGYLDANFVDVALAVRPSVSLKSCNLVSKGDGTASNPYEINYVESCTE